MCAILSPFISSYYGWNWEIKVQYLWKVSLQSFNLKHFMQKVLHLASTKLSWLWTFQFFLIAHFTYYLESTLEYEKKITLFLHFKWFRWLYDLFTTVYTYVIANILLSDWWFLSLFWQPNQMSSYSSKKKYKFSRKSIHFFLSFSFSFHFMVV